MISMGLQCFASIFFSLKSPFAVCVYADISINLITFCRNVNARLHLKIAFELEFQMMFQYSIHAHAYVAIHLHTYTR